MQKTAQNNNKSLKTFFLYAGIVLFFVFVSLAIKVFFLINASKFDGNHQFVIAIGQKNTIKQLVSFDPDKKSATILQLKGKELAFNSLSKTLNIIPDAKINTSEDIGDDDIGGEIKTFFFKYNAIKTDMTIIDIGRLMLLSQKPSLNEQTGKEIFITNDEQKNNNTIKDFFTDEAIFSENVSVQIINASGMPGVGKRLETILTNLGCNIVAVSTSRKNERISKIQYFGNETYTLKKLKNLLGFQLEKTEKKSIATIVIIIGEERKNLNNF